MGSLFGSPPGPLLTSDMQPLDRYGTHQKTISRRPEQMYSPSGTGLEMAWGGSLFTSMAQGGAIIRVRLK